MKMQI